ncbi:MAG: hypothetical protein CME06_16905 [Gemmatimonadetes bacterium]|nr:hypothetical protein [Gemmatimonadota bacterium]
MDRIGRRAFVWLCVAAMGCRYGIGGFLPDHLHSISIPPVTIDGADVPASLEAETVLTEALRDAFVQDNSLTVLPGRRGDSRLDVTLSSYEIVEGAEGTDLSLRVGFLFRDAVRGVDLASSSDVEGTVAIKGSGDDEGAVALALESLADELATEIVSSTVRGW